MNDKSTEPLGAFLFSDICKCGEATIVVVNTAGQKILTESIEVTKGKHFFYFTGEMLPAGRYFYTIESPRGRQIVTRSLLIVK